MNPGRIRDRDVTGARLVPDIDVLQGTAKTRSGLDRFADAVGDVIVFKNPDIGRSRGRRHRIDGGDQCHLQPGLPAREAVVEIELNDGTKLSERVSAVRGTSLELRRPGVAAQVT